MEALVRGYEFRDGCEDVFRWNLNSGIDLKMMAAAPGADHLVDSLNWGRRSIR